MRSDAVVKTWIVTLALVFWSGFYSAGAFAGNIQEGGIARITGGSIQNVELLSVRAVATGVGVSIRNANAFSGYSGVEYFNSSGVLKGYVGLEANSGANQHLRVNSLTGTTNIYGSSALLVTITPAGVAVTGGVAASTTIKAGLYTVATLPTCNAAAKGARANVTDAMAPAWLAALVGGGAVVAPAFCNGAAWVGG